jgi:two-component system response regulator AtoC
VPPLRERKEDLPQLVARFLEEGGKALAVAPETLEVLAGYDWPGNVRELKNVVASAAALADGPTLEPRHLVVFRPQKRPQEVPTTLGTSLPMAGQTLEQLEKAAIEHALQQFDGNRTKAAKALGIASSTLYEKLKRYGLVAGKTGEKASG